MYKKGEIIEVEPTETNQPLSLNLSLISSNHEPTSSDETERKKKGREKDTNFRFLYLFQPFLLETS